MALGAWDAPNATLGASDAPNATLGASRRCREGFFTGHWRAVRGTLRDSESVKVALTASVGASRSRGVGLVSQGPAGAPKIPRTTRPHAGEISSSGRLRPSTRLPTWRRPIRRSTRP
ncbi:hypothetical protein CU254_24730 [Amycolatopsis sp. AA4]|nr:hypothetical protein CU254_24730 [Amycolatopsis sp. AA4]